MKKVLLIPYCHQLGSTHTLLEIGRVLNENGYKPIFAGEGYYLRFAKEAGFDVVKLREIPIEKYRECTDKGSLDYLDYKEIDEFVKEELALFDKIKPDLIIDTLRPTAYISTKIAGIPRISLIYAVLTKYYKDGLNIPESHFLYATKFCPPLLNFLSKKTVDIRNLFYKLYAKPYRKYLNEKGYESKNIDYSDLITGDRTFIYDIKEYYPIGEMPDNYKYIGAILFKLPSKKPDWMDEVVKIKREKNLPVVYLSMGSTGKLYPKILSDLITYSKNRELLVVGNTCLHPVNKECKKNNNVFLTDFAPADYILPVSDVVITHGGKGTIYHALKKGVPLIGIPHQLEQEWNIKRLEQLNLGKFVSKKHYTYELLADAIEEVLEKIDFYKTNCKKYANIINNFKSEEIILSEVKEILSK